MKILNISLDPHLLDAESVVASRVRAYGRIVDEYYAVVPTPAKMHVSLADNVHVYGTGGGSKIVRLFRIIRFAWQKAKNKEIDIITVQDPYFLGLAALFVAKWHHLGLETQILGLEKTTWLRNLLARFVLKRVSFVRALSNKLYQRLHDDYGVEYERMRVVPIYVPVNKLGLDVRSMDATEKSEFENIRSAFRDKYKDSFNFLAVCRLIKIKNIDLQLNALKSIVNKYPNALLHIVGEGPERKNITEKIKKLGLEDYVVLHGVQYHTALGVFYMECDCFLFTSHYEGWGMVVVEAATAGLPVIMTDVGCAGELVVNEEGGLVIPVNDLTALESAMERMISEPGLRQNLSQGIVSAVKQLPDFDSILKQYRSAWDKALSLKL